MLICNQKRNLTLQPTVKMEKKYILICLKKNMVLPDLKYMVRSEEQLSIEQM